MSSPRPGDIVRIVEAVLPGAGGLSRPSVPVWDRPWEDDRGNHQIVARARPKDVVLLVARPHADHREHRVRQSMLVVLPTGMSGWVHSDECELR